MRTLLFCGVGSGSGHASIPTYDVSVTSRGVTPKTTLRGKHVSSRFSFDVLSFLFLFYVYSLSLSYKTAVNLCAAAQHCVSCSAGDMILYYLFAGMCADNTTVRRRARASSSLKLVYV